MSKRERDKHIRTRELRRDMKRIEQALPAMPRLSWHMRATLLGDAQKALHTPANVELHHAAADLFRRAFAHVYPAEVGHEFAHFQPDSSQHLDLAIEFLEADPWFFRSGYVKADLLRQLGRTTLPDAYAPRIQRIVLMVVDADDRREFRRYCWFARHADDAALRDALAERIAHGAPGVRRRAQWMLNVLNTK